MTTPAIDGADDIAANPAHEHEVDNALIPAAACRRDYLGGISAMTEWRWRRDGLLPQPITIRSRCYYRRAELMRAVRALGATHAVSLAGRGDGQR